MRAYISLWTLSLDNAAVVANLRRRLIATTTPTTSTDGQSLDMHWGAVGGWFPRPAVHTGEG